MNQEEQPTQQHAVPTEPGQPEPGQPSTGTPSYTIGLNVSPNARLPIPGNAEWALWFVVEIVFAIIWAASDALDAAGFVTATTVLTAAYLLSRGIAKASRVLEQ
jgi:hypothetical protein